MCCETIPEYYELTMRNKVELEKYAPKRYIKRKKKSFGIQTLTLYTAVTATTSGRCFTS